MMRHRNRVSFENERAIISRISQSQNRSPLGEESVNFDPCLQNVQIAANSRNENPDIQQKRASIQKRNDFGNLQYRKLTGSFMDDDHENVDSLVGPSVASVMSNPCKNKSTSPLNMNPPVQGQLEVNAVFDCNPHDDTMFAVTSRQEINSIVTERKNQKD